MISVTIELSSQLKVKANNPPESIEVRPPCLIQDCVRLLADECGSEFSEFIFDDAGVLRATILLSINDAQVLWDDHHLMSDGDRISILSPIAGG